MPENGKKKSAYDKAMDLFGMRTVAGQAKDAAESAKPKAVEAEESSSKKASYNRMMVNNLPKGSPARRAYEKNRKDREDAAAKKKEESVDRKKVKHY